jgi:hypothetical protein
MTRRPRPGHSDGKRLARRIAAKLRAAAGRKKKNRAARAADNAAAESDKKQKKKAKKKSKKTKPKKLSVFAPSFGTSSPPPPSASPAAPVASPPFGGGAPPPASPAATAPVPAAAAGVTAQREVPLRDDAYDTYFTGKGGDTVVPLTYSVHEGLWAFRLTDLIVEQLKPAAAANISSAVRISAKLTPANQPIDPDQLIPLQIRINASGLHIPATRTELLRDPSGLLQKGLKDVFARKTVLVTRKHGPLDPDTVEEIIFEHGLYETARLPRPLTGSVTAVALISILNNPDGGGVLLRGQIPPGLNATQASLSRSGAVGPFATARIDPKGQFLLDGRAADLFPGDPQPATSDVTLNLDQPPAGASLGLHYRLSRRGDPNPPLDAVAQANHTPRAKLIQPAPVGVLPEIIPPLHLCLA